jgi:hypothetical protein
MCRKIVMESFFRRNWNAVAAVAQIFQKDYAGLTRRKICVFTVVGF